MTDFVLVASPLVGAPSWAATANVLRTRGARVHVPDVPASTPWRDWPARLQQLLAGVDRPILVGHSAAGLLIADLAIKLSASKLIFLDAQIPPVGGAVPPVDNSFMQFVNTLPVENGLLPIWSQWWGANGVMRLFADPSQAIAFEQNLPRTLRAWFDDSFNLRPWGHVPAAYIQTSTMFAPQAEDATKRGWPVVRIAGTHLHPLLAPEETADAIEAMARA